LSGVAASVGGIATAVTAYADKPELAILNGAFTLANVGFLVYRGGRIADKYKEIGKAEGELEQIRENPTYKKLDLIE
jgi:hypothetical protein